MITIMINEEHSLQVVQVQDPKEFDTINLAQFNDFVPIENNAANFELGSVINDLKQIEAQNHQLLIQPKNQQNNQNAQMVLQNKAIGTNQNSMLRQPEVPQFNWNVNQAQNNPFVPKMWFPNSTITINYNFGNPNPK